MTENEKILITIKETVKSLFPLGELILFGSRARADYRTDSDFDILIILPNKIDIKEKLLYKSYLRKKLVKDNIIADILIESKEEVKTKRLFLGHIVREALKEGIAI